MTVGERTDREPAELEDDPHRAGGPGRPEEAFRKHEYPADLQRGLFTVFLDDDQGQHVAQVWASTPGGAASVMAPWAKGRLRCAERDEEVSVELLGWSASETPEELSSATGIPEEELDPGLDFEFCLSNVWYTEHEADGRKWTLYVIETVPWDQAIVPADSD